MKSIEEARTEPVKHIIMFVEFYSMIGFGLILSPFKFLICISMKSIGQVNTFQVCHSAISYPW